MATRANKSHSALETRRKRGTRPRGVSKKAGPSAQQSNWPLSWPALRTSSPKSGPYLVGQLRATRIRPVAPTQSILAARHRPDRLVVNAVTSEQAAKAVGLRGCLLPWSHSNHAARSLNCTTLAARECPWAPEPGPRRGRGLRIPGHRSLRSPGTNRPGVTVLRATRAAFGRASSLAPCPIRCASAETRTYLATASGLGVPHRALPGQGPELPAPVLPTLGNGRRLPEANPQIHCNAPDRNFQNRPLAQP